jgi:hypothetical protein
VAYFGSDGKPVNSRQGYARVTTEYDSQGTESRRQFYDVAGNLVVMPRFRVIRTRPPHVSREWIHSDRTQALARLEQARKRLLAGEDFGRLALEYSDIEVAVKRPGDDGYYRLNNVYPIVRLALENLKVGEVSLVFELPSGFYLAQRVE